jgi:hypothetical protein
VSNAEPAVSIVVATYNRADLLPESLDSFLSQNYPDLEVLVVDDGSSDRTRKVLKRYAKRLAPERFRYVNQDNAGQAVALNRGYAMARGDLIGYMPDDDLLEPGAVAAQAAALAANPEAVVAYSGYRVINAHGVIEDVVRPIQHSPVEAIRLHDTVIGPGALVRKAALAASSGWPVDMRMMADFVLWADIGLRGSAIRVDAPLVSWRRHAGSVTLNLGVEHSREHLAAFERALALDGFPELTNADRAEGLRNACVWAAIMGGQATTWPGERYFVCDLERKVISAGAAGCDLSKPIDWNEVERSAALFRELVEATVRHANERRPPSPGAPGGTEAALARLREVGVIAEESGEFREADEAAVRYGLLEAAVAAGAVSDPRRNRFRIIDRELTHLEDDELSTLETIGFGGSADDTAAALSRL